MIRWLLDANARRWLSFALITGQACKCGCAPHLHTHYTPGTWCRNSSHPECPRYRPR